MEVLADDDTRALKSQLNVPAEQLYPWLARQVAAFAA